MLDFFLLLVAPDPDLIRPGAVCQTPGLSGGRPASPTARLSPARRSIFSPKLLFRFSPLLALLAFAGRRMRRDVSGHSGATRLVKKTKLSGCQKTLLFIFIFTFSTNSRNEAGKQWCLSWSRLELSLCRGGKGGWGWSHAQCCSPLRSSSPPIATKGGFFFFFRHRLPIGWCRARTDAGRLDDGFRVFAHV